MRLFKTKKGKVLSVIVALCCAYYLWYRHACRHLLLTLDKHRGIVYCIAFSPDGALLLSGSFDKTIKAWCTKTGTLKYELREHTSMLSSIAFHRSGALAASGDWEGTLMVWDLSTRKPKWTTEAHTSRIRQIVLSPTEDVLASCGFDDTIALWDVTSGKRLSTLHVGERGANCLCFSTDGQFLVWGGSGGAISLYSMPKRQLVKRVVSSIGTIQSIVYAHDPSQIIVGSFSGDVEFWDASLNGVTATLDVDGSEINSMCISADGKLLGIGTGETISPWPFSSAGEGYLVSLSTQSVVQCYSWHWGAVGCVAFSPDGRVFATACYDSCIRFWNIPDLK